MKIVTVTFLTQNGIITYGGGERSKTSVVKLDDVEAAIERAVKKCFGKKYWFSAESGITTNSDTAIYGRIACSVPGDCAYRLTTDRIRIDVE